jgi:hypothetical protein
MSEQAWTNSSPRVTELSTGWDGSNAALAESEDCGLQAFMDQVDMLIVGGKTNEQVFTFG